MTVIPAEAGIQTMKKSVPPSLFSLMSSLTAEERQKFAERRRVLRSRDGVKERLVEAEDKSWRLEYWRGKEKIGVLTLP